MERRGEERGKNEIEDGRGEALLRNGVLAASSSSALSNKGHVYVPHTHRHTRHLGKDKLINC